MALRAATHQGTRGTITLRSKHALGTDSGGAPAALTKARIPMKSTCACVFSGSGPGASGWLGTSSSLLRIFSIG